ncbi:hypothetical protein BaRGS_00004316 [Batillaria attramentaria]|uniref:Uncharacterized protein n=1 Tax=Batillaria attramentaria TaxID=370345 RepID=A0ABD0LZ07_9CAEN
MGEWFGQVDLKVIGRCVGSEHEGTQQGRADVSVQNARPPKHGVTAWVLCGGEVRCRSPAHTSLSASSSDEATILDV